MTLPEQWRPVGGFPYEVSDRGNVRNAVTGHVLRPGRTKSGHYTVALGRGNSRYVHILVAAAFIGPCPPAHEVRHRDDNGAHNALPNLVYGTRSENNRDKKWNNGTRGHKLTPADAEEIKQRITAGATTRGLAREFGVWPNAIHNVKTARAHGDV